MAVSVDHVTTWDSINEDVKDLLIEDFKSSPNIVKLLYIISSEKQKIDQAMIYLAKHRLISTATGKYLDLIGEEMGMERNGATDEEYRTILKIRAYRVASSGTRDDIIDMFARFTGTEKETINTYVGLNKTFDVFFYNLCLQSDQAVAQLLNVFPILSSYRLGAKAGSAFGFTSYYATKPPHGIGGLGSLYTEAEGDDTGRMTMLIAQIE
ncbi:putative tail terminator protein [Escherichia phage EC_OE_11]|nr:putative tail terminator protein [Escherichia phage JohannJBalmer]UGL62147.1 putative baseplate wedge protein [Escherichia phage JLBYU50]WBF54156.1 putative tail terminator protein [Escherichia phage EC_OE_11]CAH7774706.1 structural protein [Enterobacteria phage ECGD1] [Escherichia phage vB_Eco_PATM]HAZ7467272.1 hypothetical protein [Escherichia coli]